MSRSVPSRWPIGDAAFVAASWTWCIGMFLPVLLVRDMGLLGWVVFAVPNVLGAAALAWIVPNAEASRHLVDRHRAMAAWFSIITIAFHVFFVQWIVFRLAGLAGTMLVMAALGVCAILLSVRAVGQRWTAGLVLIGSVVLLVLLAGRGVLSMPAVDSSPAAWRGLAGLAPACFLGFLLCPYLDLTFHRARQQTSAAGGRFAFGFGFGVLFLVMILFTLLYAHLLAPGLGRQLAPAVAWLLTIHFAIQIGFTLAAHLREVWPGGPRPRPYPAAVAVAVVVASALGGLPNLGGQWLGLERGELIYRGFMGFYGLFFPAYVWICMVPGRDGGTGGKTGRLVFILTVAVALPFFAAGFLGQRMLWVIPGVAIVLLARLALPKQPRAFADNPPAPG